MSESMLGFFFFFLNNNNKIMMRIYWPTLVQVVLASQKTWMCIANPIVCFARDQKQWRLSP
jgi:hypothetical protein